jgi:hypothetical protein
MCPDAAGEWVVDIMGMQLAQVGWLHGNWE